MTAGRALFLAVAALSVASVAQAHVTGTGLATISVEGERITYRLSVSLAELPQEPADLIARAAQGDVASAERLAQALREQVRFELGGAACRPGRVQIHGSRLDDGRAQLQLGLRCPESGGTLKIDDALYLMFGEHYQTIASLLNPDGSREERVFAGGRRSASFDLVRASPQRWMGFLLLGLEHILTGYDHLMFVAALLLGTRGRWRILGIVTAFTVAHSVTLCVAVLGLVTIPSAVVEPAIAASIVWVALENLYARDAVFRRWAIGFAFGLVHGFGFASALKAIGLSGWPFARALLAFNLGVELGQAAVVLAVAPLLMRLGEGVHPLRLRKALSILLAVAGATWLVARIASL